MSEKTYNRIQAVAPYVAGVSSVLSTFGVLVLIFT